MNPANKKKKANPSVFSEILGGIAGVFFGDTTSFGRASAKITIALLFLIGGIVLLTRPFVDPGGKEIQKGNIPYAIGLALILLSIWLIISWIRKRKTNI